MSDGYHLECPDSCSLKPGTQWGATVSDLLFSGTSHRKVLAALTAKGGKTTLATLTRHRKHIIVTGQDVEELGTAKTATNIEILEAIVQKGYANAKNWKPTISDTMKAMDMWFRLTAGNPFDELLDTLAAASIGADSEEEVESNPAALSSLDEQEELVDSEG